jgi:asparagine synthase (glutamine-hydrolysing)
MHHARLPIVDLSHGSDQPFVNDQWVFAFVGELINYKEFDSVAISDARVMWDLWRESGDGLMGNMDGFWAIVAFNKLSKQTHVITDFLAKKPLYIHLPSLSVCSEIKPLLDISTWDNRFDEYYFSTVRKFGYCMNEHTFVRDIIKVPPRAHWILDNKRGIYRGTYERPISPSKVSDIRPAIEKAVKQRVQADVPISLLLSGGLDSTIIFELIKKHTLNFSVYHVFNDESEYLNYLKIPLPIKVYEMKTTDNIKKSLMVNEGPVDLGSMLPQYSLHKAIRENNPETRVVLTGDGADEIFGGYKRSTEYDSQYSDIYDELVYYHLPRLDKMSMAFTMELRSPFLSRNVIGAALSLPWSMRQNKNGLKVAFYDIVHPEILNRKKHPLKSQQVLNNPRWRDELQILFKEMMYEHYGCRNT